MEHSQTSRGNGSGPPSDSSFDGNSLDYESQGLVYSSGSGSKSLVKRSREKEKRLYREVKTMKNIIDSPEHEILE